MRQRTRSTTAIDIKTEVAKLRRKLNESQQQRRTTADVLKVIGHSTFDLQKVLDTLIESACRLCDSFDAVIFLREAELLSMAAHYDPIPIDIAKWPLALRCCCRS